MQQQDQAILESLKDTVREMESYIREEYCTDYDDFLENDILKRAIAMCLISSDQMISCFSDDFITKHQRIVFARFTTIRYIAERSYQSLDFYALWIAATEELPAFLNELFSAAGMELPAKRLGQVQGQARMQEQSPPYGQVQSHDPVWSDEELQPRMQTQASPYRQDSYRSQAPQEPVWQDEEPRPRMQTQPPSQHMQTRMDEQAVSSEPKAQEARQPFVMNELYKRQAYNQMMQMNMTKEESAIETKKEVDMLLDMLAKEKRSRGL